MKKRLVLVLPVLLLVAVLGTVLVVRQDGGGGTPSAAPSLTATASSSPDRPTVSPSTGGALSYFGRMSTAQRVGQLFMTGGDASAVSSTTLDQIGRYHIGSVFLAGRSSAGVSHTAAQSRAIQARASGSATAGVPEFVATDQEGGYVQVLSGPGFSTIPTALTQGGYSTGTLQADATTWGRQLRSAGVNLNLAPVMGTVPSAAFAKQNAPIGYYDREFGYDPGTVASHGRAFVAGMSAAGVDTAVKHFPGLGRVTANTDTTSYVADDQTTRGDSYVRAFDAGLATPSQVVMVSSAVYTKIDASQPATFSSTVIDGMIRGDAHFTGVVMSDDINGKALSSIPAAERATRFIDAGGDLILSNNPNTIPTMYNAVLSMAYSNAAFRAKVEDAARRVLLAKQRLGLIKGAAAGDLTGARKAGFAVFRPSNGTWYRLGLAGTVYGQSGDIPVPADYADLGRAQLAVFRPSTGQWYVQGKAPVVYGQNGDVPVPGDYLGRGSAQFGVFRPSTGQWFVGYQKPVVFGQSGDIPVPGDYDGDGRTDLAVFRPSTGQWFIQGHAPVVFGQSGDVPVPGDYNGDGRTDLAVFRPSTGQWFVIGNSPVVYAVSQADNAPVPADYRRSGGADLAVFSGGSWYVIGSAATRYGDPSDIPVG